MNPKTHVTTHAWLARTGLARAGLTLAGLLLAPQATAQDGTVAPPGRGAYLTQSLILDFAGAWFSTATPLQTGGHDPRRSGLTLQGLEWTSTAHVDPYLHFTGVAVFTTGGVEIEEAYAQTTALPANLAVKAGQFLLPVGRLNGQHLHAWHFIDQALHIGRVYGAEGGRALGVQASWLAPLPWSCEVALAGTAAAGGQDEGFGIGDMHSLEDGLATLQVKQFLGLGEDWGVQLGLAAQVGAVRGEPWPEPVRDDTKQVAAADVLVRWRPVADPDRTFAALLIEAVDVRLPSHLHLETGSANHDATLWGGAAQLVVGLDPRWEVGGRSEHVAAARDDGTAWSEQRHTGLVTFKPTEFSRLRLQGHLARGRDRPTWQSGVMLALEVFSGDHAAHPW